eukprot:Sdes_comp15188_c0_seq1m4006
MTDETFCRKLIEFYIGHVAQSCGFHGITKQAAAIFVDVSVRYMLRWADLCKLFSQHGRRCEGNAFDLLGCIQIMTTYSGLHCSLSELGEFLVKADDSSLEFEGFEKIPSFAGFYSQPRKAEISRLIAPEILKMIDLNNPSILPLVSDPLEQPGKNQAESVCPSNLASVPLSGADSTGNEKTSGGRNFSFDSFLEEYLEEDEALHFSLQEKGIASGRQPFHSGTMPLSSTTSALKRGFMGADVSLKQKSGDKFQSSEKLEGKKLKKLQKKREEKMQRQEEKKKLRKIPTAEIHNFPSSETQLFQSSLGFTSHPPLAEDSVFSSAVSKVDSFQSEETLADSSVVSNPSPATPLNVTFFMKEPEETAPVRAAVEGSEGKKHKKEKKKHKDKSSKSSTKTKHLPQHNPSLVIFKPIEAPLPSPRAPVDSALTDASTLDIDMVDVDDVDGVHEEPATRTEDAPYSSSTSFTKIPTIYSSSFTPENETIPSVPSIKLVLKLSKPTAGALEDPSLASSIESSSTFVAPAPLSPPSQTPAPPQPPFISSAPEIPLVQHPPLP